ncbi:EF-hand calcium-binding domain-containing protein 14 isoform X2 [Pseudophryne corroboree]|uniref:EF-hand calcium-binding domain-containing protein 14 isoform X2 n=1 Tax=Pseudophryne corroboree TaxID=495146 RepID=UPI003081F119
MGSGALSAGPPPPPTPHKKMKKRKELNALIGLAGDGGRKKPKKGSGHRLLRTEPPASDSDTDTEEEEDGYSSLGDRHFRCRRVGLLQCCKVCYPFCGFIVLTACTVTCIGLVWMQVALKENIDTLKEQYKAIESSQKNSLQELPKINEDLLVKQKHLDEIVNGDRGLNMLWTNITEMNKQIALLTSAVNQLKANLKSASDLINLPKTMEELQKSVASLGSTLTSVHHDVETMQTAAKEQKRKVETLQKEVASVSVSPSPTAAPGVGTHSLTQVENTVEGLNATMLYYLRQNDLRLHSVDATISNISQRVSVLESNLLLVNKTDSKENDSLSAVESSTDPSVISPVSANRSAAPESSKREKTPASEIQEQLQLIHALTSNPDSDKVAENGRTDSGEIVTAQPLLAKMHPRSLKRKRSKQALWSPSIITARDADEVFRQSPQGVNGKLSLPELKKLLGPRMQVPPSLAEYDVDGDDLFSLTELKAAIGA